MGKYEALQTDIYSIFATSAWIAEAIKTVPENYVSTALGNEYIRVSIVSSGVDNQGPLCSANGQLIIDIFIPAGNGALRAVRIADKLDTYLAGKTFKIAPSGNTQLGRSALTFMGVDKADSSLYRASYSINFNYFGN